MHARQDMTGTTAQYCVIIATATATVTLGGKRTGQGGEKQGKWQDQDHNGTWDRAGEIRGHGAG